MNFWKLRFLAKNRFIKFFIRNALKIIYFRGRVVTIQKGPLTGYKWKCDTDHQFWMPMGLYEQETANWLVENLKEGMTFFDIGANAGYLTLLGSKLVGDNGFVVAFEPIPLNLQTISSNLNLNQRNNVKIEPLAVYDQDKELLFSIENNNANSHVSDIILEHAESNLRNQIKVQGTTLDSYLSINHHMIPDLIKIDVEGAEVRALNGAINTIKIHRPILIISTHSNSFSHQCEKILKSLDYKVDKLPGFEHELCCFPKSHMKLMLEKNEMAVAIEV